MDKVNHLVYVPFTGLGLYNGHRGNRWLRNRITIFKRYVVPSLQNQSVQDFILWVSWRPEDRGNRQIVELEAYLKERFDKVVFTYAGVCFWDDKYPDDVAHERLIDAIHGSMGPLLNEMNSSDTVLMTIQPSDDCYIFDALETMRERLLNSDFQVVGFKKGYVMDYTNGYLAEWNPKTTPPFYTIKFSRETFGVHHPLKHLEYTGPYKSHEYVKDYLKAKYLDHRGFLVGTHGENISTIFNHPYTGEEQDSAKVSLYFGIPLEPLKLPVSLRKSIMRKLPHGWQRKLRYLLGEKFYAKIYAWIRS